MGCGVTLRLIAPVAPVGKEPNELGCPGIGAAEKLVAPGAYRTDPVSGAMNADRGGPGSLVTKFPTVPTDPLLNRGPGGDTPAIAPCGGFGPAARMFMRNSDGVVPVDQRAFRTSDRIGTDVGNDCRPGPQP